MQLPSFLKSWRTIGVLLIALAHILFFSYWYASESGAFQKPVATIEVAPRAYDPRDLLSGQYMRMNYEFSRIARRWNSSSGRLETTNLWAIEITDKINDKSLKGGDPIWIKLEKQGSYRPVAAFTKAPAQAVTPDHIYIKGIYIHHYRFAFGIERYYIPEGTKEPNRNDMIMRLDVYKDGKVRIKHALVNGKIWP